jgi:Tol biopolymer transport system component
VEIPLPEERNLEGPTFSPDGCRIVVQVSGVADAQLWIWDRDQETQTLLTVEGDFNANPVWTPDRTRISFGSVGPRIQINWQSADGSDAAELLFAHDGSTWPGSWTPDGTELALTARRERGGAQGNWDIGLLTLRDSTVRWLLETDADEFQPEISPDGTWLAFTSNRSGQAEVYVQALDGTGGQTQVSTGGGHSPRWSPDGATVYFATDPSTTIMAASVRADGGFRVVSRAAAFQGPNDFNVPGTSNWDVGPDGEQFVYIAQAGRSTAGFVWVLNWPEIVRGMTSGN